MNPMLSNIPPALFPLAGALLIPLFKGRLKVIYMLLLPVLACAGIMGVPDGTHWVFTMQGKTLVLGRVDGLSRGFGAVFSLAAFTGVFYAIKVRDDVQHVAALTYAGGAIGVALAGDLFSFYIFWEIMAVASTFLVLARKTGRSYQAAFRYVMVHLFGGLSLLGGIILHIHAACTLEFSDIGLSGLSSWLIFTGVAVNAAMFPLHGWLKDAYPEATATGAVFLSAFTTKSAVYAMARMFPGTELLIWMGALSITIPILYAVIENDVRRVLSYSLINQVGFMLCGIGIGSDLALNGAVAHAICHVIYKSLLFMTAGAVMEATGETRCTELGGLWRTMPLTALFCLVGTLSIAAFPFFSGFVSKTMIAAAAAEKHLTFIWFVLMFGSACIFHYIKVPWCMFFSRDPGLRPQEAPTHMLLAMGITALFCIWLGIFYRPLYAILPHPAEYIPYTVAHVTGKMQLLLFATATFFLLIIKGLYPEETDAVNLDTDWFYRKGAALFHTLTNTGVNTINRACNTFFTATLTGSIIRISRDAPVRLAALLLSPFNKLRGDRSHENLKRRLYATFKTGTVPTGVAACLAVILIAILFVFALK